MTPLVSEFVSDEGTVTLWRQRATQWNAQQGWFAILQLR